MGTAEISTMRLDIGDIQEALKNHDSWMEDVSNTLQQMQEKEENLTEDIINLKNEMNTKLDTKVDNVAWKEANDDLDAAIKTVRDMVSSLRLDVDARRRKVDEILATIRHDITAVETNLEESKAKTWGDTDQAVNALNGRIDFTNKDLAATQESLHTTQNSLSDCFNEVAVVRSDLERSVADTEARLKNDIRQKQQEAFEKIGSVEQQAELRSAEASRRLGALDLRMSGVQGGLGEHKRDILKLREEVNGLTVKSASHEVDIQKNSDAVRKMEKQRNMDEQNWKAQMDAVHDVLAGCRGVPGPALRRRGRNGPERGGRRAPGLGGVRGEHVIPRGQSLAAAVLAEVPQHSGHDREEGGPQRAAVAADLAAAHRVPA